MSLTVCSPRVFRKRTFQDAGGRHAVVLLTVINLDGRTMAATTARIADVVASSLQGSRADLLSMR